MKVAVTAEGPTLEAAVDPRFGRCPYFIVVSAPDLTVVESIANPFQDRQGGAGIQAGKLMAERGVQAVLTGRCGPNAVEALAAAGIRIVPDCTGTVREAVEAFVQRGGLSASESPQSATGPNPVATMPIASGQSPGAWGGSGRVQGRGFGRGKGPCGGGMANRHRHGRRQGV